MACTESSRSIFFALALSLYISFILSLIRILSGVYTRDTYQIFANINDVGLVKFDISERVRSSSQYVNRDGLVAVVLSGKGRDDGSAAQGRKTADAQSVLVSLFPFD